MHAVSIDAIHQNNRERVLIHSDEGLTLETSVFESFTVANLPYRPCGWIIYFRERVQFFFLHYFLLTKNRKHNNEVRD